MSLIFVGKNGRIYRRKFDHEEAKRRYEAGESVAALARKYDVSSYTVRRVVSPAVREREALLKERSAAAGRCDDCDGPMNGLSRYSGSRRCRACAALAKATSVRDAELQCVDCRAWKPDEDFPRNRAEKGARRGRHTVCRPCQTVRRQEHRRRNREATNAYDREYRRRRRAAQAEAEGSAPLTIGERSSES